MLSIVGKKFYLFWSVLLLIFPITIHLFWLNAVYSSDNNENAISIFIGYFPLLFQFTSFLAFINMFSSTLAFMFSLRLIKGMNKYTIFGVFLLVGAFYLMVFNIWNLI